MAVTGPPPEPLADALLHYWPSALDQRMISTALGPWRALTEPTYYGLDRIPADGAVLLVGNHTVLGMLDMPLMLGEIHRVTGRFVRGMADHAHFAVPVWRDVLVRQGGVRGTPENCRALLGAGEAVLVYPGGGREVAKRKGEKYQLLWKQRMGFARLAIEAGCPIVPFAAVGAEESYDILLDADSPVFAPLRGLIDLAGGRGELIPPLVRGIGPTPLPRPQRFYFAFGEPIDTRPWAEGGEPGVAELRDHVRAAVEERITFLLAEREAAPDR
ncbi:MAG TPA: lysophospholipid acyltransferase family protein [Pseudonocardia sp.]|jgi:1-acyl-sn-glycerol-3-phosphate acyltransferase|nr:lysophospholipid acyltransferase family protein [Pseudonocardia sp.]